MEGIVIKTFYVGTLQDIVLLRVSGYVDTTTSPELQKIIAQFIEKEFSKIIIDLGEVQYVSSAGWGVFVGEIRGLREKGGDLKLAQMVAEVYDVFEMLEFNRIITSYDSIFEAIDDFDFSLGLPLIVSSNLSSSKELLRNERQIEIAPEKSQVVSDVVYAPPQSRHEDNSSSHSRQRLIEDAELPLTEKVKKLVIENPALSTWMMKKFLFSPRFGYTKINYFKLRSLLKKLGLDSKSKRYRFYRSRG
jgi:anti-sigma B factor antagonist